MIIFVSGGVSSNGFNFSSSEQGSNPFPSFLEDTLQSPPSQPFVFGAHGEALRSLHYAYCAKYCICISVLCEKFYNYAISSSSLLWVFFYLMVCVFLPGPMALQGCGDGSAADIQEGGPLQGGGHGEGNGSIRISPVVWKLFHTQIIAFL